MGHALEHLPMTHSSRKLCPGGILTSTHFTNKATETQSSKVVYTRKIKRVDAHPDPPALSFKLCVWHLKVSSVPRMSETSRPQLGSPMYHQQP